MVLAACSRRLHGDLGHAGQLVEATMPPTTNIFRVAREAEIRPHLDPSGAVELGAGRLGQRGGQGRGLHAGRPDGGVGSPAGWRCRPRRSDRRGSHRRRPPRRPCVARRRGDRAPWPPCQRQLVTERGQGRLPPSSSTTRTQDASKDRNSPRRLRDRERCQRCGRPVGTAGVTRPWPVKNTCSALPTTAGLFGVLTLES